MAATTAMTSSAASAPSLFLRARPLLLIALAGAAAVGAMVASTSLSSLVRRLRRENRRRKRREGNNGLMGNDDAADLSSTSIPSRVPEGTSQHLLNILYEIAEDQARRAGFTHRGVSCSHCNVSPIVGVRYKCSNCSDVDLCETCEAAEVHARHHVFLKIRVPIPPFYTARGPLLPPFYPGGASHETARLRRTTILELQSRSHFGGPEIEALFEQFQLLAKPNANGENSIDKETFLRCLGPLGIEPNPTIDFLFEFYDQDQDGVISFPDLVCGLSILRRGTFEERIRLAFCGYDIDGDGFISQDELTRMLLSHIHLTKSLLNDLIGLVFVEQLEGVAFGDDRPVSAHFTMPIVPDLAVERIAAANGEEEGRDKDVLVAALMRTSESAIEKVVRRVFGDRQKIDFETFRAAAVADRTLTLWLDVVGTVF